MYVRQGGVFEGGGENKYQRYGVPCHLLSSTGRKPIPSFSEPTQRRPNAPSTDTVLIQDPDMRRNVHTAPLLAPQMRAREKTLGRRRAACLSIHYGYVPVLVYAVFKFLDSSLEVDGAV